MVGSGAQGRPPAVTMPDGPKDLGDAMLGGCRVDGVAGIEHSDDSDGTGAIQPGPLAVNQGVLNIVPVTDIESGGLVCGIQRC